MAIELPANWASFSGGSGASCELSTPAITSSGDIDCHGTASVTLSVSGGVGPYSWGTTKGVLDSATGTTVHLTPPANPYAGSAGTLAYVITTKKIHNFCSCLTSAWDCYGNKWQTCTGSNACTTCFPNGCSCSNCASASDAVCDSKCTPCQCGKSACVGSGCPEDNGHCFCVSGTGTCQPCAITMEGGAVVTVTDSLGQSTFVTVSTIPRTTI